MPRIPEGDDWRDYAEPCPNCRQPVLSRTEHYAPASMTDPAWYTCDSADMQKMKTCPRCDEELDCEPDDCRDPDCPMSPWPA